MASIALRSPRCHRSVLSILTKTHTSPSRSDGQPRCVCFGEALEVARHQRRLRSAARSGPLGHSGDISPPSVWRLRLLWDGSGAFSYACATANSPIEAGSVHLGLLALSRLLTAKRRRHRPREQRAAGVLRSAVRWALVYTEDRGSAISKRFGWSRSLVILR